MMKASVTVLLSKVSSHMKYRYPSSIKSIGRQANHRTHLLLVSLALVVVLAMTTFMLRVDDSC